VACRARTRALDRRWSDARCSSHYALPECQTTLVGSYFGWLRVTTGVRGLAPFARFIFRAALACQQLQLLLRTLEVPPRYSPVLLALLFGRLPFSHFRLSGDVWLRFPHFMSHGWPASATDACCNVSRGDSQAVRHANWQYCPHIDHETKTCETRSRLIVEILCRDDKNVAFRSMIICDVSRGVLVVWIADWAWLALLLRLPRTSRKTFSTANCWRRTLRLGDVYN